MAHVGFKFMVVQITAQKYIAFLQRKLIELEAEKSQLLTEHKVSYDAYISHIKTIRDTLFHEATRGDLRFDRIYTALCNVRERIWDQHSFLDKLLYRFNIERQQVWVRRGLPHHDGVNCGIEEGSIYVVDEIRDLIKILDDFLENPRPIPPALQSLEYEMSGILQNFSGKFITLLTELVRELSTLYADVNKLDNRVKKITKEIDNVNQVLDTIKALNLEDEMLSIDSNSEICPV
jgi:hypothetical protein